MTNDIGVQLLSPSGLVSSPAFSHVAVVPPGATMIYVGGQNAVDADGTLVGGDDVAAQTRQTMINLATALEAVGASVADLISVTLLIAAGQDLRAAYGVAAPLLATDGPPPLVTAAIVASLAVPGALLEVAAIAAVVR